MKLAIPFNWDSNLIEAAHGKNVGFMYGRLNLDFIGTGQESLLACNVSSENIAQYILQMHRSGIKFNYILDGTCINNLEWTRRGQNSIRRLLDWLIKAQVDSVTISIPYLVGLIRKCYPALEIEVSHCAQVDTLLRAKRWEDSGVSVITLAPEAVNGNLELIKIIRRTLKCQLQVLADEYYLSASASYNYYSNRNTHLTQEPRSTGKLFSLLGGDNNKILFRGPAVRQHTLIHPDETSAYKEAGIERIKLLGSSLNTDTIIKIVSAYSRLAD